MEKAGIVVIGRNEGDRLKKCLGSLSGYKNFLVYVDSGSTDESVQTARRMGLDTVELDPGKPFTAARARNEGFEYLLKKNQNMKYVQFVDGDCLTAEGWIERALEVMETRADVAVVCGKRREMFPAATIYNFLCQQEWDAPFGEIQACGGDSMMRVSALRKSGGFDGTLIAGEEPELCVRLREKKWKVLRVDADMTHHDAAITSFFQWWKKNIRSGYGFAEVGLKSRLWGVREVWSAFFWTLLFPGLAAAIGWPLPVIAAIYAVLLTKIAVGRIRRGDTLKESGIYAVFCVLAKLPQMWGVARFFLGKAFRRKAKLIEYKTV